MALKNIRICLIAKFSLFRGPFRICCVEQNMSSHSEDSLLNTVFQQMLYIHTLYSQYYRSHPISYSLSTEYSDLNHVIRLSQVPPCPSTSHVKTKYMGAGDVAQGQKVLESCDKIDKQYATYRFDLLENQFSLSFTSLNSVISLLDPSITFNLMITLTSQVRSLAHGSSFAPREALL